MAFHVYRTVQWAAGEGTPPKYEFILDADVDVTDFTNQVATISVRGYVTVINHPTDSRNSWAASDFAVLVPGNVDISAHPFINGASYYEQAIPFLPDPQNGDVAKMLVQFRGDTWRNDPVNNLNRSSIWTKNGGLVLDQFAGDSAFQFDLITSFEIPINTSGNTTILAWDSSGANNSTDYSWVDREVWASWFDLDYRPSALYKDGQWLSANRSGGERHILTNPTSGIYTEMRTVGGPTAVGTPPSSYHGDKWYNQIRTGYGA